MLQIRWILLLLILASWSNSWSEVTLDGSLGRSGALSGPNFQITENLGRRAGSNLFHSFGSFNLNRVESATFSGTPGIQNVISRVTGGSPSSIDGALRSTIPNANLYFLNPAGVIFGANASLDVQGSFHVSTADYLGLADGTQFSALSPDVNQVLTTAAPEAFGFLGDNPSAITLAQTELKVPSGESLSVIGGEINLENTDLIAPAGRIDLASANSKGEVMRQDNDLRLEGFEQLGKIELTERSRVNASGEGGGAIFIRGGELTLNESVVRSDTIGSGVGKAIDITLPQGTLELRNGGKITSNTINNGKGSDLLVEAQNITFNSDESQSITGLLSGSMSSGDGGNIEVKSESVEIVKGSTISSLAAGDGKGGDVLLQADSVLLSGKGLDNFPASLTTVTQKQSSGNAGNLTIQSSSLVLNAGAFLATVTLGAGAGGIVMVETRKMHMDSQSEINATGSSVGDSRAVIIKADSLEILNGALINTSLEGEASGESASLLINAEQLYISGDQTGIKSTASKNTTGITKDITIKTGSLELRDGALISANTKGTSNAANISIEAEEILVIGGRGLSILSAITATTFGSGAGGNLRVTANNILLSGFGGFFSGAVEGSGDAGKIDIKADNLLMRNGSLINTSTGGTGKGGDIDIQSKHIQLSGDDIHRLTGITSVSGNIGVAGTVSIAAEDSLILDNADIIVSGITANGGDINISVNNRFQLSDSQVTTSTLIGGGNGGNILIGQKSDSVDRVSVPNVIVLDNSKIIAQAAEGQGGKIGITSDFIFKSQNSIVDASSREGGIDGTVSVNSPETNISGSIVALPESFINATEQLSQRCVTRSANNSSFVVKDRGGIPPGPEDAASSTYFENSPQRGFANNTMANRDRSIVNNRLVAVSSDSVISNVSRENNTQSVFTEYDCGE